jgi:hypothetical protein
MPFLASSWKDPGVPEVQAGITVLSIVMFWRLEQAGNETPGETGPAPETGPGTIRETRIPVIKANTIPRCLIETPIQVSLEL